MSISFSSYFKNNIFILGYHLIVLIFLLYLFFYTIVNFDFVFNYKTIFNPFYFKSVLYYLYGHYGYISIVIANIISIFYILIALFYDEKINKKILIIHGLVPLYGSFFGYIYILPFQFQNFGFFGQIIGSIAKYYLNNKIFLMFYLLIFLLFIFIITIKKMYLLFIIFYSFLKAIKLIDFFSYIYKYMISWILFFLPSLKNIFNKNSIINIEELIYKSIYSDFYKMQKYSCLDIKYQYENIKKKILLPYQIILHEKKIEEQKYQKVNEIQINLLLDTLNFFSIKSTYIDSIEGPLINTIIVNLENDVKLSKLDQSLQDIARIFGKHDLRICYPVFGYPQAIAFEYSHEKRTIINFLDYAYDEKFVLGDHLEIMLGLNAMGKPFYINIAKAPHILVAGTTGSGKSNILNLFIISLIWKNKLSDLQLILIDPKKSEFFCYDDFPHLLFPVACTLEAIENTIKNTLLIMDERYKLFAKNNCKNIYEYNLKHNKISFIVVIIDEYADIAILSKQIELKVVRLLQMSRAAGIHVIISTQRPSADIINSIIKSNLPLRIACKVTSSINSRIILDCDGAEKLLGNSDSIVFFNNIYERVHGIYIDQETIENIKNSFK
jgi:hypothetical protein